MSGGRLSGSTAGILVAVTVAMAVRVAVGLWINLDAGGQRGFPFYGQMAEQFLAGEGMHWKFYFGLGDRFANRGPLYPLLLAALWSVTAAPWGAIVGQALVGGLGCLVPAALATRWGGGRAGVVAAWVAALWPYDVVNHTAMVEHVLYGPLVILSLLAVMRLRDRPAPGSALVAGLCCGVAALARLTFFVSLPLLAATLLPRRRWLPAVALLALGAGVALAPWVVRNHAAVGHYTLGTDGGRALWVGTNPSTFSHYPAESIDASERVAWSRIPEDERAAYRALRSDEVAQDRRFRERALAYAAREPAAVVWGSFRKMAALWSPVHNPGPAPGWKFVGHAVPFTVLLAAFVFAFRRVPRVRADLPVVLAAAVSFTATAAVFWGQPRYLAPLYGLGYAAVGALVASRGAPDGE